MVASKAFEKAKAKVVAGLEPKAAQDEWYAKKLAKVKALEDWPANSADLRSIGVKFKAVLLRAELAEKFPLLKFSVRVDYFSMGSAIDVHWKGKPAGVSPEELKVMVDKAEGVVGKYSDAGNTDAMVDYFDYDNFVHFNEDFDQKYPKKEAEAPAAA